MYSSNSTWTKDIYLEYLLMLIESFWILFFIQRTQAINNKKDKEEEQSNLC